MSLRRATAAVGTGAADSGERVASPEACSAQAAAAAASEAGARERRAWGATLRKLRLAQQRRRQEQEQQEQTEQRQHQHQLTPDSPQGDAEETAEAAAWAAWGAAEEAEEAAARLSLEVALGTLLVSVRGPAGATASSDAAPGSPVSPESLALPVALVDRAQLSVLAGECAWFLRHHGVACDSDGDALEASEESQRPSRGLELYLDDKLAMLRAGAAARRTAALRESGELRRLTDPLALIGEVLALSRETRRGFIEVEQAAAAAAAAAPPAPLSPRSLDARRRTDDLLRESREAREAYARHRASVGLAPASDADAAPSCSGNAVSEAYAQLLRSQSVLAEFEGLQRQRAAPN
jgi:hypothetical protein